MKFLVKQREVEAVKLVQDAETVEVTKFLCNLSEKFGKIKWTPEKTEFEGTFGILQLNDEAALKCRINDYLVWDGAVLSVYSSDEFNERFEQC